ncbi:Tat pathway signal protein [Epibacterium sp. SM1969]|uniref:Tat pathway signal protein n=1 Tax=Tritonibacter aquimaris TaxID=2663379 RepID=A0A844AZQ2_9RHOB|nr:nitroreductase family protein [Tritonibacter aquimaris]MQY43482.1 Tat pathway signal protein [Tritonibacter aquimaris]
MSRRRFMTTAIPLAGLGAAMGSYGFWPRLDRYHSEVEHQRQLLSENPDLPALIRLSTLAANSHNTQPWRFRVAENAITLSPDFSRRTAVVDPDDHHLYVSLGCASENLRIAARAIGRPAEISLTQAPSITCHLGRASPRADALYQAIPLRQSTRAAFDGMSLSREDLELLRVAAQQDGVQLMLFTQTKALEQIGEFVVAGNSAQMDDPAFIAELRRWIRFSPQTALDTGDGLFSACSGNLALPEWIASPLFNRLFTKEAENRKYRDHIRSSAGVAVFVAQQPDPAHWIKVGQSFERFALQATALGIRTAHINQPVEVPGLRTEFARWLGLPDQRPDLVVRFGRAPALPMSLRRPVRDVML